ncbi:hypothetical protein BTN82_06745 [Pseudomonas chlororaphis]|uniref:GP-PDE domain-containing protein n=2 Tax=Pseudomonas chlororaphis TaxID=587753 RepID=A0A1Q8EV23_9PSED|nr:hypothetical protein BTN82_06745 [Pseudomonas chlororaphis]
MSAIKNVAIHSPVEIIELDIKTSRDHIPYLMHDNYLQRTTNFVDNNPGIPDDQDYGKSVLQYPESMLKALFLKLPDFSLTTESPPTFREALLWVKKNTQLLINIDINDDAVFQDVWNVVKEENAFDVCIFKGGYSYSEFKTRFYDTLTDEQKNKLIYFPIIPGSTESNQDKSLNFYHDWEKQPLQIAKGYEVGYRKDSPGAKFSNEAALLNVVSDVRKVNRVRVNVFSTLPDTYEGRYRGNVNINQCCNAVFDSRGDWQYLLDPQNTHTLDKGVNGYIITDDPATLDMYLSGVGRRDLTN